MALDTDSTKSSEESLASAGPAEPRRWRFHLGIRWYLFGLIFIVLAGPLLVLVVLQVADRYLVRQTERQLISQSVVIGEIWRAHFWEEEGVEGASFRPPGEENERYVAVEPVLDFVRDLAPPQPASLPMGTLDDTSARRAGARVEGLLRRAQVFNLSAIRILDDNGCVVATTRGEPGRCLHELPEVAEALSGRYTSVVRERQSDEPPASLRETERRRGTVRVFTALPIFSNGEVVAVVRASRTSIDTITALWRSRRWLLLSVLVSAALGLLVILSGALIAQPLRRLTRAAASMTTTTLPESIRVYPWTPREIVTLRDAFTGMGQRLRAGTEYIREFAANASHELKTPLTSIRGATELLRHDWKSMDNAQRQRFLDNVDEDAGRMERLVRDLLFLARVENPQEGVAEVVDVHEFFEHLPDRYSHPVELVFEGPPTTLHIDPERLSSAVGNVIDNAVRYSGVEAVELRVGSEGGRLRVEVRDHGPGISARNQERIFDRFFTTERDAGGTGLGLAIAQAIVRGRGGSIRFETDSESTAFILVF